MLIIIQAPKDNAALGASKAAGAFNDSENSTTTATTATTTTTNDNISNIEYDNDK